MKNFLIAFIVTVFGIAAFAQAGTVPQYDKSNEVRVSGTVQDVRDYQCPISGTLGSHLTLKTNSGGLVEVHLAATKYTKSYEMIFAKGDAVEVLGSRVMWDGVDTVLAREITRKQETFMFRDKEGKPLW